MSSRRILRSRRRAMSDPAAPSTPVPGDYIPRPESPLTPIESEGPSVRPKPDGQGLESELYEPDADELNEPSENPVEPPRSGGVAGGREVSAGNNAPEKQQVDEPMLQSEDIKVNKISLSPEQELTVKMAEANLNDNERERIARRHNSVRILAEDEESREEGPSTGKGKGIDPRNWGNVRLDDEEMNPGLQAQILASLENVQKQNENSRERRSQMHEMFEEFQAWQHQETERFEAKMKAQLEAFKREMSTIRVKSEEVEPDILKEIPVPKGDPSVEQRKVTPMNENGRRLPGRPSALIAPSSHVGKLFNQMKTTEYHSESDKENDPYLEEKMEWRAKGMKIKPLKPTEIFDGTANLRSFQRNMREIIAYLEDSRVPDYRQVEVASRFLKGKAYTFFERICGENASEWTLKKFYEKLYDFAFPIDFRTEQRRKLVSLQQKNRRVCDHIGIFNDLCNTAGTLDERHKVIFLWDSFDSVITKGLLRMGHTPEISSLEDIIEDAEKVELIENVGRNGSSNQTESMGEPKSKGYPNDRSGGRTSSQGKSEGNSGFGRGKPSGNRWRNNSERGGGSSNGRKFEPRNPPGRNERTPGSQNRLTEEQKNEYRAAGKCFECGETGHRSRDCPKRNTVKADNSKRSSPPGLATYNLEFELGKTESNESDIFEMTVNHIDWFQDVEDTYYSDSSEGIPELVWVDSSQEESDSDAEPLELDETYSGWRSDGIGSENSESEESEGSDSSEYESDSERSESDERVRCGPESEWDDSRHDLEEIRYKCSPLVLFSIQNSIRANRRKVVGERPTNSEGEDPLQRKFGDPLSEQLEYLLLKSSPYPAEDGDEYMAVDRFCAVQISATQHLLIDSSGDDAEYVLPTRLLRDPDFRPVEWFLRERGLDLADHPWAKTGSMGDPWGKRQFCYWRNLVSTYIDGIPNVLLGFTLWDDSDIFAGLFTLPDPEWIDDGERLDLYLRDQAKLKRNRPLFEGLMEVNGIQIPKDQYAGLQRNAASVKDPGRKIARPIVIVVRINGHPVSALIDSGSLGTFMSTTLIDQLKFKEVHMESPLTLQLAVQGSRSKINRRVTARFELDVRTFCNYRAQ
ncbi:hypothetical protein EV361DRAFT_865776 [Lentinula raphanica]|nr:hypothetical protein EV361DRAFT_865776 [Lentinula raphanica]